MYISDRPAKSKKAKKNHVTQNSSRNSFSNSHKEIMDKHKADTHHESLYFESLKKDCSKTKGKGMKKKKKVKRESLDKKPMESLKSNLIKASKFSTFEISKCDRNREMRLEDLKTNDIPVLEDYNEVHEEPQRDLLSSGDDVLVGSATNLASSDRNIAETTEETTPKAKQDVDEVDPNYIEVLSMDCNKENRRNIQNEPERVEYEEPKMEQEISMVKSKYEKSTESDYFKAITPMNESRGEELEEFITPEINTSHLKNHDGKSYFQNLIDIPEGGKEEEHNFESENPLICEDEPELPSDSYFIMILPENGRNGGESSVEIDEESSREVCSSESAICKKKYSATTETVKGMFYVQGEGRKKSQKAKAKPSSAESMKISEIRLPLIVSGSIANDCIQEAGSEEEETEKIPTEQCSNGRVDSTYDDYELEYSMQDTNPNITNSKFDEAQH